MRFQLSKLTMLKVNKWPSNWLFLNLISTQVPSAVFWWINTGAGLWWCWGACCAARAWWRPPSEPVSWSSTSPWASSEVSFQLVHTQAAYKALEQQNILLFSLNLIFIVGTILNYFHLVHWNTSYGMSNQNYFKSWKKKPWFIRYIMCYGINVKNKTVLVCFYCFTLYSSAG